MHKKTRFQRAPDMNQRSFASAEYALKKKRTRREKFLAEMERVVPWARLIAVIEPLYPTRGHVGVWAVSRSELPGCCACTACSSGMAWQTRRWGQRAATAVLAAKWRIQQLSV
ncbi:hypothetical protein RCH10_004825 [Variovorax sp. GrIS 2.14]|jgi:hypothetical protein